MLTYSPPAPGFLGGVAGPLVISAKSTTAVRGHPIPRFRLLANFVNHDSLTSLLTGHRGYAELAGHALNPEPDPITRLLLDDSLDAMLAWKEQRSAHAADAGGGSPSMKDQTG